MSERQTTRGAELCDQAPEPQLLGQDVDAEHENHSLDPNLSERQSTRGAALCDQAPGPQLLGEDADHEKNALGSNLSEWQSMQSTVVVVVVVVLGVIVVMALVLGS